MTDISSAPVEAPHNSSSAGRALTFLAHRWPSLCGLLAMTWSVLDDSDGRSHGLVVFLAAFIYLGTAVVSRPKVVWILFGAAVVGVTVMEVLDFDRWPALVAGAVCVTVLALVSGLPQQSGLAAAQIPLMLVFGAAAVAALSLSPALGAYLVAVALIGHATLDVILWRTGKVVARSMAEFCAVLDFTLGIAIIVLQLT